MLLFIIGVRDMTVGRTAGALACLAAAFLIGGAAKAENHVAAKAECPSFPTVACWGKLSHDKAIRYVAKKHDGDWSPYVEKWRRQLASLEKIQARDGTVVFKRKGLRLNGEDLDDYVLKVEERVMINACLAEEDETRTSEAEKLENFPTAAGSNDPAPRGTFTLAKRMDKNPPLVQQAGSRSQIERGVSIADAWVDENRKSIQEGGVGDLIELVRRILRVSSDPNP